MSFPRYPIYKDSTIQWLGQLPEHWGESPLKCNFKIVGGSTPKSDNEEFWDGDIMWATPSDLSNSDSFYLKITQRKITAKGLQSCSANLVPSHSIILSTRAPIGSLAIAAVPMCTNQGCKSLIPHQQANAKYFAYLLSISGAELNIRGKGTTFLEISGDELKAFRTPAPPLQEQIRIASFLDRETAQIDQLVAEQQRLLALLKEKRQAIISHAVTKGLNSDAPMKSSGIEWLGDVPAHWTTPPLYMRYSSELGKMLDGSRITGDYLIPYVRNVDVQWGTINFEDLPMMDIRQDEYLRYTLRTGDLLVCEGGEVGRASIVPPIDTVIGYQKALHRARPLSGDENVKFLYYTFLWAATSGVFDLGGASTIAHLTGEQLRKYRFPRPPRAEQDDIVAFLEIQTSKFDILTAEAQRAIGLLQERRNALISSVVTGQIDVRSPA